MSPTLMSQQYLLVNKLVYHRLDIERLAQYLPFIEAKPGEEMYLFHPPRRGDIVVFRYPYDPTRDFVKRVIGVPGDTVQIVGGVVYVNGARMAEPYVLDPPRHGMEATLLGPEEYFVLGDNRNHSNDSKDWGPVSGKLIIGSVWIKYWPFSQLQRF